MSALRLFKKQKLTLKTILLKDKNWLRFHECYKHKIRPAIIDSVLKLLSCGTTARGEYHYSCENSQCSHKKVVPFTCKNRLCSSCGKKATLIWVEKQSQFFPDVPYQHIVFTMPIEFAPLFWANRPMLNVLCKLAAECLKTVANEKRVHYLGIFEALHTFGGDLKKHVHVHVSIALGGLNRSKTQWIEIKKFNSNQLFRLWRAKVIKLFRDQYNAGELTLVGELAHLQNDPAGFNRFLDKQFKRWWNVYCQKPDKSHKKNTEYFSRYVKRPAIANSRLHHYNGSHLFFDFYNHKTKKHEKKQMTSFEFIAAVIQHIPDKGFRLIRYYGFLSNRLRGHCLPIILRLLNLPQIILANTASSFAQCMQQSFNFDPLKCILCGANMKLARIRQGVPANQLYRFHHKLASGKPIR